MFWGRATANYWYDSYKHISPPKKVLYIALFDGKNEDKTKRKIIPEIKIEFLLASGLAPTIAFLALKSNL